MSEIMLAKQTDTELTEQQRAALRIALFEMVDGLSEQDQKAWRRFWNWIWKAGSGELFAIETWTPRKGTFHRRHMKIESTVFKAQERVRSFEQFRYWLKIGAGFVDWMAGPKGGVVQVPRSISYKKFDDEAMRRFHDDSIDFLRTPHAQAYLWPHLQPAQAAEMMETLLARFNE